MAPVIPAPIADGLAAYRLTRLVTADVILAGWRDKVVFEAYRKGGDVGRVEAVAEAEDIDLREPGAWSDAAQVDPYAPELATLVTCRWCAGMWVSLGVVAARRYAPRLWGPLAQALAYSAGAALLAGLED